MEGTYGGYNIAPPPFNTVSPFSNLKEKHSFRKSNIEILHGVLKQRLNNDMLLNRILDRNLLTNSKWRPQQTKCHVTNTL